MGGALATLTVAAFTPSPPIDRGPPPIAVPPRFRAGLGGAAGFWKQRRDKPRFKPFVPLGGL